MDVKAIVKGLTVGTAAGFAVYSLSSTGRYQRHKMKKRTSKAVRAAGNIFDDIASFIY